MKLKLYSKKNKRKKILPFLIKKQQKKTYKKRKYRTINYKKRKYIKSYKKRKYKKSYKKRKYKSYKKKILTGGAVEIEDLQDDGNPISNNGTNGDPGDGTIVVAGEGPVNDTGNSDSFMSIFGSFYTEFMKELSDIEMFKGVNTNMGDMPDMKIGDKLEMAKEKLDVIKKNIHATLLELEKHKEDFKLSEKDLERFKKLLEWVAIQAQTVIEPIINLGVPIAKEFAKSSASVSAGYIKQLLFATGIEETMIAIKAIGPNKVYAMELLKKIRDKIMALIRFLKGVKVGELKGRIPSLPSNGASAVENGAKAQATGAVDAAKESLGVAQRALKKQGSIPE